MSGKCLRCKSRKSDQPFGWIDEKWSTIGGGSVRIVLCFTCRRLIVPHAGSDRCDGRCGGLCDSAMAWWAKCITCVDLWDDEVEGEQPSGSPLPLEWSCWDEKCVRSWADLDHHGCDVSITQGWRNGEWSVAS
jgi:hypothetical protein